MPTEINGSKVQLEDEIQLRKPWQTPVVEVLMVDQTEAGNANNFDGTGFS